MHTTTASKAPNDEAGIPLADDLVGAAEGVLVVSSEGATVTPAFPSFTGDAVGFEVLGDTDGTGVLGDTDGIGVLGDIVGESVRAKSPMVPTSKVFTV